MNENENNDTSSEWMDSYNDTTRCFGESFANDFWGYPETSPTPDFGGSDMFGDGY